MCPNGPIDNTNSESTTNHADSDAFVRKLSGFQNVIPQFDGLSSITPQFFLENVEQITNLSKCTPDEKLLVLRSRIRGDALTNVINSPDLNQEKNYDNFKKKFLSYFDTEYSLGAKQRHFANCKMFPQELVKNYSAKVCIATQNFFNNPDLTNASIKALFEQTKLAKFIEGLLPTYKQAILLKEPKTYQEAVDFVQRLQGNEIALTDYSTENSVNNIQAQSFNQEIKNAIDAHASSTREMINSLTKEIENLKVNSRKYPTHTNNSFPSQNVPQRQNYTFRNSDRRISGSPHDNRRFTPQPRTQCNICHRENHSTRDCYYNTFNSRSPKGRSFPTRRGNFRSFSNPHRNSSANYIQNRRSEN